MVYILIIHKTIRDFAVLLCVDFVTLNKLICYKTTLCGEFVNVAQIKTFSAYTYAFMIKKYPIISIG